jgi:Secretion system C-terminal sorting domain/Right handed beta helix region
MKLRFYLSIITAIIWVAFSFSQAKVHYIDKNASGNNDGTSWLNAWQSFAGINWNSIGAGDTIYISGGTSSTIYTETLDVSKSGSSDNPIVITKGTDAGHNGNVIIDGEGTRYNGINISGINYITVKGITLRNSTQGLIEISHSEYILVENCQIYVYGRAGVFIQYSIGTEVRRCTIETGTSISYQTDGIYSQYTVNDIYDYNNITVNNNDPGGHDDCIQSYQDNNLTIHSNICEQNNSKTSNAQGIFASVPQGGTFRIYNNLVNLTSAISNGLFFDESTGNGGVEIIGNTIYGENATSLLRTKGISDPIIINNIIYSGSSSFGAIVIDWNGNPGNINNNLIYLPNSTKTWNYNGNTLSWDQWRALGFDAKGINADPFFKNISGRDFSLQAGSPAINAGATLGSPYNIDILGAARPVGTAYDIGCYEGTSSGKGRNEGLATPNSDYSLSQNYPNPFNPGTTIEYDLLKNSNVQIKVYDLTGREVEILVDRFLYAGHYSTIFNGSNLAGGVYFYRLIAGNFTQTKKMILLK